MSRKRKAAQELVAAPSKRNDHPGDQTPKSARSALVAREPLAEAVANATKSIARPNVKSTACMNDKKPGADTTQLVDAGDDLSEDSASDDSDAEDAFLEGVDPTGNLDTQQLLSESQFPRTWKRARELIAGEILAKAPSCARVFVGGLPSSGKNAFAKYLLNTILQPPTELELSPTKAVAMLYLDPNSGANALVGHVALRVVETSGRKLEKGFEPTTSHSRSIPVGLYGQKEDSKHFLTAVTELSRDFQQLSNTMPMIICCPSVERESEQGIDIRTLQSLLRIITPNHVCFLHHGSQHSSDIVNVISQKAEHEATVWELEVLVDARNIPNARIATQRSQKLRRYFREDQLASFTQHMGSVKPYDISYAQELTDHAADIGGCLVFGDVPPNHPFMLSRILNGSIIAVASCKCAHGHEWVHGEGDGIPFSAITDPTVLLHCNTLGLALVRSVDHTTRKLHLVLPTSVANQLENVPTKDIILIHGVADSPGWAYQQDMLAGFEPNYLGRARKGMQIVKSRRFKKR